MKTNRLFSTALVVALLFTAAGYQTGAQTPTARSGGAGNAILKFEPPFPPSPAQVRPVRRATFKLMPESQGSNADGRSHTITSATAIETLPAVHGTGTIGKIPIWADIKPSGNTILGDSVITQSNGNIGIGTASPASQLTVQGFIEASLGGYKFPDGTIQTTAGIAPNQVVRSINLLMGDLTLAAGPNITITPAGNTVTVAAPNALAAVAHDQTLTGNGTTASPLSVAFPSEEPFQKTLDVIVPPGVIPSFSVPSGKRLIIEFVSVRLRISGNGYATSIRITTEVTPGSLLIHHLVPSYTAAAGPDNIVFVSETVRIYAAQGTTVYFQAAGTPSITEGAVTFSGRLVDEP